MPRNRHSDLNRPDAAFAALAVEAAQAGDVDEAERLARMADRFGRLKLRLEPGELQRLSRVRALERRMQVLEHRLEPLIEFLESAFEAKLAERAAGDVSA